MGHVEHRATLREELGTGDATRRRARLAALGELVARLHAAGWYHRDLYLHQVVVRPDGELCLFDLGRARRERRPRVRWFVKDLAALLASAPPAVTRAERLRFLAGWLTGTGRAPGELRPFARRVMAKAARLAAHAPKHTDEGRSEVELASPLAPTPGRFEP